MLLFKDCLLICNEFYKFISHKHKCTQTNTNGCTLTHSTRTRELAQNGKHPLQKLTLSYISVYREKSCVVAMKYLAFIPWKILHWFFPDFKADFSSTYTLSELHHSYSVHTKPTCSQDIHSCEPLIPNMRSCQQEIIHYMRSSTI